MNAIIAELLKFKALVKALIERHLAVRYRGSFMGFFWSLLNPLCLMTVYTLVFSYYMRSVQMENYAVFLFCGLLPWIWSSSALIEGTNSIISGGHLLTKSQFPPHVLPFVTICTSMVHFVLSLPILAVFMAVAGQAFHWTLALVPLAIALQFVFLWGLTLLLSSLNVLFRDVQHVIANLLSFLFFLCPIVYPVSAVPEQFRFTFALNPLAEFTTTYQKLILEGQVPGVSTWGLLIVWSTLSFLVGSMVFDRYREGFAELL